MGIRSLSAGCLVSMMAILLRKLIIYQLQTSNVKGTVKTGCGIASHKDEKRGSNAVSSVYVENRR